MQPNPEILYIEDNPADVLLLKSAFKICGFSPKLHIARDGVEGLEFLYDRYRNHEVPIDLVLLDLNLPRKNGFDVLREIRENQQWTTLHVITYSGSVNPEDFKLARKLKANDSWPKPQDFQQAIEVAEKLKNLDLEVKPQV